LQAEAEAAATAAAKAREQEEEDAHAQAALGRRGSSALATAFSRANRGISVQLPISSKVREINRTSSRETVAC